MKPFSEDRFNEKLEAGLKCVKRVLESNKKFSSPENVGHSYDDKYLLADNLTNTSIMSILNVLRIIGFTDENLNQVKKWVTEDKKTVTLILKSEETCSFRTKKVRKPDTETKSVTSISVISPRVSSLVAKFTSGVSTKITDYYWKFTANYSISVYPGTDESSAIRIRERKATGDIITSYDSSPRSKVHLVPQKQVNITWLFQKLNNEIQPIFGINRDSSSCYTPRRNQDVKDCLNFLVNFGDWSINAFNYIHNLPNGDDGLDMGAITADGLFIPVLPIFSKNNNLSKSSSIINVHPLNDDLNNLFGEQKRSIEEKLTSLSKAFPDGKGIFSLQEAHLAILFLHLEDICQHYIDGIQFIEEMLKKQLVSAIGKFITPNDFAEYMNYHYRKLFKKEYQPQKFCYSIYNTDHHPEGVVSIETTLGSTTGTSEPIITITKKLGNSLPMKFVLDAATKITLNSDIFVHAWINQQFSGELNTELSLNARSGPFSSYIIMIGNIIGKDRFSPKHAVIMKSKDLNLYIPLIMEHIPSPKEFRDATESLPPKMKEFAQAYRSMQLEGTLFGLCMIQIKPQMEKLLNLPKDSLSKEIELTEDLQDLFITYQIPSDLLSYDGKDNELTSHKISRVKYLVNEMKGMVMELKADEIDQVKREAMYEEPIKQIIQPKVLRDSLVDDCFEKQSERKSKPKPKPKRRGGRKKFKAVPKLSINEQSVSKPMSDIISSEEFDFENSNAGEPDNSKNNNEDINNLDKKKSSINEDMFDGIDVTTIPTSLDKRFESLDPDAALRSSIIKVGEQWKKTDRPSFLTDPRERILSVAGTRIEKNSAFDLLDSLSRSGILDIDFCDFHIIVASTHSFDDTLMDTLIKKNINPIDKMERSALIVSTTLERKEVIELIQEQRLEAIQNASPQLLS